jgi:hypothetical protein
MARKKRGDEVENPKPRIGRGEYARGERIFKPSKKLQRKYKTVRETYKTHEKGELTKQEQKRKEKQQPKPLSIEDAFRLGIVGSKVKRQPVFTSIVDKIAILSNEYTIPETAEMLGVDNDFLEFALQGNLLNTKQTAILEHAYSGLKISHDDEIDFAELERLAEILQQAIIFVNEERYHGNELKDNFRYAVATGRVNVDEDLDKYLLFGVLAPAHKAKIMEWLVQDDEDGEPHTADKFFDAYSEDLEDAGGIWESVSESLFWAWFRETFYS